MTFANDPSSSAAGGHPPIDERALADSCERAGVAAADMVSSTPEVAGVCADAAILLRAVWQLLERPITDDRVVAVRRGFEAGLAAAAECAAACAGLGGDDASVCAELCEEAADDLRHALARLVDDDVDQRSGAT